MSQRDMVEHVAQMFWQQQLQSAEANLSCLADTPLLANSLYAFGAVFLLESSKNFAQLVLRIVWWYFN